MRLPPLGVCVTVLACLRAGVPSAGAGESGALERRLEILGNPDHPDAERVRARDYLVRQGAATELVELAKQTKHETVRLHVAIALSRLKAGREVIAANFALLQEWRKAEDPALGYWAVQAIANARTPEAVEALGTVLQELGTAYRAAKDEAAQARRKAEAAKAAAKAAKGKTGADAKATEDAERAKAAQAEARAAKLEPMLVAVARALGSMEKAVPEERAKVLLGEWLVGDKKSATMRVAGLEAFRAWGEAAPDVVTALFEVARTDPEEEAWRAAVQALRVVAKVGSVRLMSGFAPGTSEKERQDNLKIWESEWDVTRATAPPTKKGE
jgi:hypothetical protein